MWRYFTYSLVHVDLGHLLPNLALFLGLSISLHSKFKNSKLGFFWIFLLYVIGVRYQFTADMEKDASGASAARGSFWPMRKFGTRNKKKIGKFLRKFILDVEIRPNV